MKIGKKKDLSVWLSFDELRCWHLLPEIKRNVVKGDDFESVHYLLMFLFVGVNCNYRVQKAAADTLPKKRIVPIYRYPGNMP
jgi:hypothetical protein